MERILVIDPDWGTIAAMGVALQRHFRVDAASTASQALQSLSEGWPALVILDIELPHLDGSSVIRTLRLRRPECRVIVTSAECVNRSQGWVALDVDGFFAKPLELDRLLLHVKTLFALGEAEAPFRRFSRPVREAIGWVSTHYGDRLSVGVIARAVGISPSRLAHLFPDETGMTVKEYVKALRVEIAKRMLRDTEDSLDFVATFRVARQY